MSEEKATIHAPVANHPYSVVQVVLVPFDQQEPLQALSISAADTSSMTHETIIQQRISPTCPENVISSLLLRPCETVPGLFAYHEPSRHSSDNADADDANNLRATRLAMACGLLAIRFYGNVILTRTTTLGSLSDVAVRDVYAACEISPDLRPEVLKELVMERATPAAVTTAPLSSPPFVPNWLAEAAKNNYHDRAVLEKLASVFVSNSKEEDDEESSSDSGPRAGESSASDGYQCTQVYSSSTTSKQKENQIFVKTLLPLCLHCRRPASTLCTGCYGVYFCDPPRPCRQEGWSHDCLCKTYRIYTNRRAELSSTGLEWERNVTGREFQLSQEPYERFLLDCLHVAAKEQLQHSWWRTELDGWSGGMSESAQCVDVSTRKSYREGFSPLTDVIPPQRPLTLNDWISSGLKTNEAGLLKLESWNDYYRLRGIPENSIAALLLTFPLTMYHAIVLYGTVPCTVAQMLNRPLRIHIVGAEKELNFLDLFQEVLLLLPQDMVLELVFCIREDMLPPSVRSIGKAPVHLAMTEPSLRVILVSGTYGESIDPNFDCGTTGAPDMLIAFNAGLHAYSSWRSVVRYLDDNLGVVGVFTDYNEFSGVQCASLGGSASRNSVRLNPFRQPRAMPVLNMNLPQFTNGFFYVFNEQSL